MNCCANCKHGKKLIISGSRYVYCKLQQKFFDRLAKCNLTPETKKQLLEVINSE